MKQPFAKKCRTEPFRVPCTGKRHLHAGKRLCFKIVRTFAATFQYLLPRDLRSFHIPFIIIRLALSTALVSSVAR